MDMQLKQFVDLVVKEKNVPKEVVMDAVCQALEKTLQKKYPAKVEVKMDSKYQVSAFLFKTVVESEPEMLDEETEVEIKKAKKIDPEVELGDELGFEIEIGLGRIDANVGRQVLSAVIRRAENEKQYKVYAPLQGTVVSGKIQKVDKYGALVVLKDGVEAFMPKSEMPKKLVKDSKDLVTERYRIGQEVEFLLKEVKIEKGLQLILSRADSNFVVALFKQEVPELDGDIEVVKVVRVPGKKTKVIVDTNDYNINPVSVMIGMQGTRIQKVQKALFGERVDVVRYDDDLGLFVESLLNGVKLRQITVDEDDLTMVCEVMDHKDVEKAKGFDDVNLKLAAEVLEYNKVEVK